MPDPTERPISAKATLVLFAVVFGVTLAALLPALLPGAGLAWDDVLLIEENPLMTAPDGLWRILTGEFWQTLSADEGGSDYYRPLVSLSYWVELRVFGGHPLGHHVVNVLLHLACVALVYRWLMRRVDLRDLPTRTRATWLAIALLPFALHPSRAESVAWISGRTDPMALFWALLAMEAWAHTRRLRAVWTAGLFLLALACKETALLVVGLWLCDAWLLDDGEGATRRKLQPAMFAVASVVATAMVARFWLVPPLDRPPGSVAGVLSALGLYVRELVAPFPPSAIIAAVRLTPEGQRIHDPASVALGAAAACGLLALGTVALRRRPLRPWLADALWFVVPLAPVMQVMQMPYEGHVALRFLYIPMLGVSAAALRGGLAWSRRSAPSPRLLSVVAVALGAVYLPFTFAYAAAFRSHEALWDYERAVDPERPYVLERTQHLVPAADVERAREVAREGVRVSLRDGRYGEAASFALRWARIQAGQVPLDRCPADLLHALDDLALSREARFGDDAPVVLEIPELAAKVVRQHDAQYPTLRGEMLLRCGQLEQALESLSRVAPKLDVLVLRARALALTGKTQAALAVLDEAEGRYPHEARVPETRKAVQVAAQLIQRARNVSPVEAEVLVARLHLVLGDLYGARRLLEDADPKAHALPAYHHARVDLETLAGRPDEAARALQQARAQAPEAEPLWRQLESRGYARPARAP